MMLDGWVMECIVYTALKCIPLRLLEHLWCQKIMFYYRPVSQKCWRKVRRCEYRTYKTLCENVPVKTCDPRPVRECREKCGTVYYCDKCPSVSGPPSPPPAGTFIVGPPAPPQSRTPRKTSYKIKKRQIPSGPTVVQTP